MNNTGAIEINKKMNLKEPKKSESPVSDVTKISSEIVGLNIAIKALENTSYTDEISEVCDQLAEEIVSRKKNLVNIVFADAIALQKKIEYEIEENFGQCPSNNQYFDKLLDEVKKIEEKLKEQFPDLYTEYIDLYY